MKVKVETYCPIFDGFNTGSITDSVTDDIIEDYIDNYNEENGTDYGYDDFDFNYDDFFIEVAKLYVKENEEIITDELFPIKIAYQTLIRPKSYNYGTGSINVEMEFDTDDFFKAIENNYDELSKTIKERYTSRPGFSSFHSTDIDEWIKDLKKNIEKEEHKVGAIFEILSEINIDMDDFDYNIREKIRNIEDEIEIKLDSKNENKNTKSFVFTSINEWKKQNEDYVLEPSNGRKSFYNKAHVIEKGTKRILKSYQTDIVEYDTKTKKIKFLADMNDPRINSTTTRTHINVFLNEFGLDTMTKKEIESFNESKINESILGDVDKDMFEHYVLNQIEIDLDEQNYESISEMLQDLISLDDARKILFGYLTENKQRDLLNNENPFMRYE